MDDLPTKQGKFRWFSRREINKAYNNHVTYVSYESKDIHCPDAPCMDYLPTLGEKWPHSRGNGLVNIPVTWSIWVEWTWASTQFSPTFRPPAWLLCTKL